MYSDKDRSIYQFPNSDLKIDPLELRRKLLIHSGGQFYEWVTLFNDGDELAQAQAEDQLVKAVRTAVSLQPATQKGGVCDATVLEYLAHYLEWLSTPFVAPTNLYPTVRPCTDCPPP